MKKNWLLIITGSIVYLTVITLSIYYVMVPGINKLKEANNVKELTSSEKAEMIKEINYKYLALEQELNEKYNISTQEINQKYIPSIEEINQKYKENENSIKEKYADEIKKNKNKITDLRVAQDKEFWANGLSKKWYQLSDQISELQSKQFDIEEEERKEIRNNETLQKEEIKNINDKQQLELEKINENKNIDLKKINSDKENEIDRINKQNINKNSIKNSGIFNIILGIIVIIIPILYIILIFNRLTHLSNSVKEKWSQVDIFLKQRTDLIPNIVESVKGFSEHEKSTLTKVTKARNQVIKATTKEEEISANKDLSNVINRLLFLQEDYPELKANTNFMNLQANLKEIENNISYARQIYNKAVLKYKNKLEMFPSNVIASIFNFKPELFFTIDDDDKENPNISFN